LVTTIATLPSGRGSSGFGFFILPAKKKYHPGTTVLQNKMKLVIPNPNQVTRCVESNHHNQNHISVAIHRKTNILYFIFCAVVKTETRKMDI